MAVTESTARVEVFQNIYSIINTNKLTGTTVLATFPEKSPTFPCYVLESASISNSSLAIDTGSRELNYDVNLFVYCDARDGMQKIDQMKDNVINSLRDSTNIATLKSANISILNIDDDGVRQDQYNDMKINSGQLTISGVLLV
tara:strand:+ start:49 stop:477 length:429 start_codon:yes stop_codon:yes gene_type:complete